MNIPLYYDGKKLDKKTAASVMLLRVAYGKKVQEFEKDMQEVLKGLKKEGFDERSQAVAEMERIDAQKKKSEEWKEEDGVEKPAMPTDEELAKADETRKTLDAYNEEKKELEEAYLEARKKKVSEKVDMKGYALTKEELGEIYEVVGAEGKFNLSLPYSENPIQITNEQFLSMVANMVE